MDEGRRGSRSIEDEAEEGLLLAEYAVRMRLKNRIIVDTLTADSSVDAGSWVDEARLMLGRLRTEAEGSARRMGRERDVAQLAGGRGTHEHDYRALDTGNLERRERVYALVARRLLRWENDPVRVTALLDAAREDAADEIGAAIRAAIVGDGAAPVEDRALLKERLRLVTSVDLPALERAVRGEATPIPVPAPGRARRLTSWIRLPGRPPAAGKPGRG